MPEVALVISAGQRYAVRDLAETIRYELELQAVPASVHVGTFPEPRQDRVNVLLDPPGYARLEQAHQLADPVVLGRTIFVCTEPISSVDDQVELLGHAGAVYVLDQRSVEVLSRNGSRARLLRPGYSKLRDHFDRDSARPVDVLFLGSETPRRSDALARIADVLSHRCCHLEPVVSEPTVTDVNSPLGEGRWSLLSQTKVLVNIHQDERSAVEWCHVLDAVHVGAVVVTEHSSGTRPFVAGEHLFAASIDTLPYVVDAVLSDEARLARVRQHAYERLHSWLPFSLWISILRATIVELVGEPFYPNHARQRP